MAKAAGKAAAVATVLENAHGAAAATTQVVQPVSEATSTFIVLLAVLGSLCLLAVAAYGLFRAWRHFSKPSANPLHARLIPDRSPDVGGGIQDPTGSAVVEELDRKGSYLDPWVFWGQEPGRKADLFGRKIQYIAKQAIACMTPDVRREFWKHIDDRHMPELMPEVEQARIARLRSAPTEMEVLTRMVESPWNEIPKPAQDLLLRNAQKLWNLIGDRAAMPERVFCVRNPHTTGNKFHINPTCQHLPEPPDMVTMLRCETCLKRERKKMANSSGQLNDFQPKPKPKPEEHKSE